MTLRQLIFLFAVTLISFNSFAQAPAKTTLDVAVRATPPFVISTEEGGYKGLSSELWQTIAEHQGWQYRLHEVSLKELLDGVSEGRYDVGIGALTVTAERERTMDFSQPFHNAGIAIAVNSEKTPGWIAVTQRFFSLAFLQVMLALAAVLLLSGFLVWWFEKRANPEEFSNDPKRGIGAGFWWAAVTMTTVGYGDKSPRSLGGRIVGLVWMFTCVIIISSFTASITSSLTVSQIQTGIEGPGDLPSVRVATVKNSSSAVWLEQQQIAFSGYSSLDDAYQALAQKKVDAVVYDAPMLQYLVSNDETSNIRVLPNSFLPQQYAFALVQGSNLQEPMNRELLSITRSSEWRDKLKRYLGSQ